MQQEKSSEPKVRKLTRTVIVILCLHLCFGVLKSQDLEFFRLNKINTNISNQGSYSDGSILKDSSGFIWIASIDGLNRWNGYEMKIFKPSQQDTTSILAAALSCMELDQDGTIWIGTLNQGLIRYFPRKDIFDYIEIGNDIDQVPGSRINTLRSDSLGQLWVGTEHHGIVRFDYKNNTFIRHPINSETHKEDGIYRSIGGRSKPLAFLTSKGIYIPDLRIPGEGELISLDRIPECIEYGPDGNIWMGYGDQSGSSIEILSMKDRKISSNDLFQGEDIYKIHYDENEYIWLATYDQLFQYNLKNKHMTRHAYDVENNSTVTEGRITEIITEEDGSLWYASESLGGGYAMVTDTFIKQRTLDDLLQVMGDLRGNQASSFIIKKSNYRQVMGLKSPIPEFEKIDRDWMYVVVSPVFWDTENAFWFYENRSQKLFRKQVDQGIETYDFNGYGIIRAINQDDHMRIWTTAKLAYFDLEKESWHYPNQLLRIKGMDTIASQRSTDLCLLKNGTIALSTADNGVYIYNPMDTTLSHMEAEYFTQGKLSSNSIYKIYENPSTGRVYFSTKTSLNIWNPEDGSIEYIEKKDDKTFTFLCMHEGENGDMWMANGNGIHHIQNDTVVARYSTLHLNRFHINAGSFSDSLGNIYYTHRKIPYHFSPEEIQRMAPPSNVVISEIYSNRKKLNPSQHDDIIAQSIYYKPTLDLSSEIRNIGFELGCLNAQLKNVSLYYQLQGFSDDWVDMGQENTIHFTNLDPGKYKFRARALSAEGRWSEEITEQAFRIRPPWYATWWSYMLYGCLVVSMFYGLYRYRVNQLLRYQRLRTKISSDLHDDVGTLLSSLAWQTDVISMTAEEADQEKFSKVSDLSRTAMERMRDTVWAIDSRKDDTMSLADRMLDYLADQFEGRKIGFDFKHDDFTHKHKLAPDVRQNIYLIFKEAIANALKYSNGDLVIIELHEKSGKLQLRIKDNGSVDPSSINTSGLGLSNMKMRADKINASLQINWEEGCEVVLKV